MVASLDDPLEGLLTIPSNCKTPAYCEIPFPHERFPEDPESSYTGDSLKILGANPLGEERLLELQQDLDNLRDRWAAPQFVRCFNVNLLKLSLLRYEAESRHLYFENFVTEEFIDTQLLRDVFFRYMERDFPEAEKEGGFLWKHHDSTPLL